MLAKASISHFKKCPQKLFLIDGVGALLSAFLLGIVLVQLEDLFGIPKAILFVLAVFPLLFAGLDTFSYLKKDNLGRLLKTIATLNLLYCLLSIGLACYHYQSITFWGWGYIGAEVVVVTLLASIELRVAKLLP